MLTITREIEILNRVNSLLDTSNTLNIFPLPHEKIALNLGFRCHFYIPDKDIENITSAVNHIKKKIYVNQNNSLEIQRFSIAERIGNLVLHGNNQDYIAQTNSVPTIEDEEADFFAANLLMPNAQFIMQWRQTANFYQLVRYFGVSWPRIRQKAQSLGLICENDLKHFSELNH